MLLKSKLLISLVSVGVVGGTGIGIYYGVDENSDKGKTLESAEKIQKTAQPRVPQEREQPPLTPPQNPASPS